MPFAPIDRRDFVYRAAVLGTALRTGAAGAAQQGARKVFFDNPDYLNVRVSPDGANLAWVAPIDSVNNLWVAPVADVGAARPVTRITGRSIATCYRWTHTTVI